MSGNRRLCILTDGHLDIFTAKTAVGLLRYCPNEVVAVLDRNHAGQDLEMLVGVGKGVPIVDRVAVALAYRPDHLVLGVATPGGRLPEAWRPILREALACGLDIVNGLHVRLNEDGELGPWAAAHGRRIWDVRAAPPVSEVGTGKARQTRARRILTVGTDCNLGKRVTAIELARELAGRGLEVEFVPTGQTGVMITERGVVIDAVVADFISGAIEAEVLACDPTDYIVVEGQGALLHPSYSAVTLGLLHGVLPDEMILCHAPTRLYMRHTNIPIPPLEDVIALYEAVLRPIHPGRVVGIALNGYGMEADALQAAVEQARARTGLPVADPVRMGVTELVDAACHTLVPPRQAGV